ncbi:MAG: NADH-quinone oxidoreductase subunit NuoN [Candidatus Nanopelagicales bacterium]|nr:NADH-quinone oxidoreductase subunit NuoN [Candidatus Nanopelagicales bacterium]MCF8539847.1 NADH-quinone oxidoreductase subunit NuoN [Candidatus Nanopelagicales bacterium]
MNTFSAPEIDYSAIAPILIVFVAALVSVLIEAFVPRGARRFLQMLLTFAALIAAFAWVITIRDTRVITGGGAIAIDGPALVMQGTILILAILGAMLVSERALDSMGDSFAPRASALPGSIDEREFASRGFTQTEIWTLYLFAVTGMLTFVAANDLLIMFIALEIMSLPLYLMVGMARRRRLLSQEAALKYFVLGAFASAFFIFGAALVYGYSATISLPGIAASLSANTGESGLVLIGLGMLLIGLFFKIGAVPFHQWTPDVYQGAPTPITAFMGAAVKVAAFGALMRLLYVGFSGVQWDWEIIIWGVAILSMLVGSLIAITQSDIKRMLAYSAVAQSGFILIGVATSTAAGIAAVLFYLIAYGFVTIGAFAVVSMVRDSSGEATHLSKWAGLGQKSPIMATVFSIFMLSLAGIPLTSGFVIKFSVFAAAIEAGATWLVLIAVGASIVAAFFYIRVIVIMFFSAPTEKTATVAIPSAFTTIAVAAAATVTVVLGIIPAPVIDLVSNAGIFIR